MCRIKFNTGEKNCLPLSAILSFCPEIEEKGHEVTIVQVVTEEDKDERGRSVERRYADVVVQKGNQETLKYLQKNAVFITTEEFNMGDTFIVVDKQVQVRTNVN